MYAKTTHRLHTFAHVIPKCLCIALHASLSTVECCCIRSTASDFAHAILYIWYMQRSSELNTRRLIRFMLRSIGECILLTAIPLCGDAATKRDLYTTTFSTAYCCGLIDLANPLRWFDSMMEQNWQYLFWAYEWGGQYFINWFVGLCKCEYWAIWMVHVRIGLEINY